MDLNIQLWVAYLYCAEFLVESDEILRVSLSIEKYYKDLRVGDVVYNRIKQDILILWVLWRWNNHRTVAHCKLSSKYSCEVDVFVSICIGWRVGGLGRVRGITCKVYTTAIHCCCRTRGHWCLNKGASSNKLKAGMKVLQIAVLIPQISCNRKYGLYFWHSTVPILVCPNVLKFLTILPSKTSVEALLIDLGTDVGWCTMK